MIDRDDDILLPAERIEANTPGLIRDAGSAAQFAWEEFFYGALRNPNTRRNYGNAAKRFLVWCQSRSLELHRVSPRDVGQYFDELAVSPVTQKLHLSAIRRLFDFLVNRHAVLLNPAASVRTERHQVIEGKTPEITIDQVRTLLASIDTRSVVGLRDRAIIATLIYTASRIGAVAKLQRQHFYDAGGQYCLRFNEKGGKSREIPARHDLQQFLNEYLDAAELQKVDKQAPLFRAAVRRTGILTTRILTRADMGRMVKRRMQDAALPARLSPHSFRVTTITDLLSQGVPLEDVQFLAGHADPRTTRLYDRRQRRVTRNIVERISI